MTTLSDEIARRRIFAITSHPDAGKTTLTEKLLLFGRANQLASKVKARCTGVDDPKLPRLLSKAALTKSREDVEMAHELFCASRGMTSRCRRIPP
jgi:hypothetical protein